MKKLLTISIIIPVYNEQGYLATCLDAIAKQTIKPLEVIVVDNNSTDKTVRIAKGYKFVRVVKEPKQGVLYARNRGFDVAKGDIIARIDADTLLPLYWLHTLREFFDAPDVAAVTGPVSYYDMPLPWFNFWLDHPLRKLLNVLAPDCPFLFGSNMAIRRQAWQDIKPKLCQRRNIHEDLDLAIHLHRQGKKIIYSKWLHVGASARRYDDKWPDFLHYGQMFRRSYRQHGIRSAAPRLVTSYYTLGYLVTWPARLMYDPAKNKRSIRHGLFGERKVARKNPMSS